MFRFAFATACALSMPAMALAQSCGTTNLLDTLSETDAARIETLVAPHPYPQGITFKAEKPDSIVTVVGTIHIPDPRLAPIVEKVRADLETADLLILESTSEDQAGLQALATTEPEMFFLTEGPTLIDLLGEEEWADISDRLAAIGIPSFFAAKFKPWYLGLTLAIPPCIVTQMASGGVGLDAQLETIATEKNIEIATLDDVEAVIALLASDPLDEQLDGLRLSLELQGDGDAMTSTLVESYFQGRIRETWELGRLMMENSGLENANELFEQFDGDILVGRNQDWEPTIVELAAGKDVVLAVGAAHLSGESGVLRALERAGYTVTPY